MKTKAAVLRNVGGPLVLEELEIPRLERGQVLVKILYSGLCRSNLNEINGRKGREFIPHLTGHEAYGQVLEIGEGVSKIKPDDYVIASWIKGSGIESASVHYKSKNDIVNAGTAATFIQDAVISENRLVKIARMESEAAALLGCAIPTGAGIVDRLGAKPGQKLAVFGIGGIGASAILRAVSLNLDCVAFDLVCWKLDWAKKILGIKHAGNYHNHCGTFDFAIECSGSKKAMETAFDSLKSKGTLVVAGNLEPGEEISIDPFELVAGKQLRGTWGGECFLDLDIPFYEVLYRKDILQIEKLITKTYFFEEINQGLEDLENGRLIRGIIKL